MLIHLFSNNNALESAFEMQDMDEVCDKVFESSLTIWDDAADQFFKQLENHYSDAFLESIIVKAAKLLADSDVRSNALDKRLGKDNVQNRSDKALTKAALAIIAAKQTDNTNL